MLVCCEFIVWSEECDDLTKSSWLPPICEGWPLSLEVEPNRPATLYATSSLGTYRSFNRGGTWERITSSDDPVVESIEALCEGKLVGASSRAGVLRLKTSYAPSPRRGLRRVVPTRESSKQKTRHEFR